MSEQFKTVYQPVHNRFFCTRIWREMIAELAQSRELIWRLFVRDYSARYRQTMLGYVWAIILPLITIGAFVFLNKAGILNIGAIDVPYAAYALLGLTAYQVFSGGLIACTNAIVAGGNFVGKINFPKEALILSAFGQTIVETLVKMVLTAVVFGIYGVMPAKTLWLLPVALLPIGILAISLGFITSLLNVLFRDIANMVSLGTTFLLLVTPILYPFPDQGYFRIICLVNPLAVLTEGVRNLVFTGSLTNPLGYTSAYITIIVFFFVTWRIFHLSEFRVAERLGGR